MKVDEIADDLNSNPEFMMTSSNNIVVLWTLDLEKVNNETIKKA